MAKPPAQRTPASALVERLAKLAAAGTPGPRLIAAADLALHAWRTQGMPDPDIREALAAALSEIDGGVTAAEDYVGEAESEKQRSAAQAQLDALKAVQAWLAAEKGGPA